MHPDRIVDVVLIFSVIAIIVLKIIGIITIPWLWLTAIIWVPFLCGCAIAIVFLIFYIFESVFRDD